MRVAISQKHLKLNESLAVQINRLSDKFSSNNYSKIENIDSSLERQDISVERKKQLLLKSLRTSTAKAFSVDRKKFSGKNLESLKKRLHNIRKILIKLRSINHYLETIFLEDIKIFKIKAIKINQNAGGESLPKEDLNSLEYAAYNLIGRAVMLDKKLLSEYSQKELTIVRKEKTDIKNIGLILRKETSVMEHLEAKLPPPKDAGMDLIGEPTFSHWVARVLSLLAFLQYLAGDEQEIFSRLKKNKSVRAKIDKKIAQIVKEKSKLLKIMEQKAVSMRKFKIGNKFKKEGGKERRSHLHSKKETNNQHQQCLQR